MNIAIDSAKATNPADVKMQMMILQDSVEDAVQVVEQALQLGMSDDDACELMERIAGARQSILKIRYKKFSA